MVKLKNVCLQRDATKFWKSVNKKNLINIKLLYIIMKIYNWLHGKYKAKIIRINKGA